MPDRDHPIPVDPRLAFERLHGFRETTLSYFEEEDAAAMRRTARLMYLLATDCHYGPRPESSTRHAMSAVLLDLGFLQGFLADIGRSQEEMCLSNADARLALLAEELGEAVGRVADALQVGLR